MIKRNVILYYPDKDDENNYEVYMNIQDAVENLGITRYKINLILNGDYKYWLPYKLVKCEDEEMLKEYSTYWLTDNAIKQRAKAAKSKRKRTPVGVIETGKTYDTLSDLFIDYGEEITHVSRFKTSFKFFEKFETRHNVRICFLNVRDRLAALEAFCKHDDAEKFCEKYPEFSTKYEFPKK